MLLPLEFSTGPALSLENWGVLVVTGGGLLLVTVGCWYVLWGRGIASYCDGGVTSN